ncbi:hypothetical protein JCM10213_006560 [Rhodosporidiobolus nylandii]
MKEGEGEEKGEVLDDGSICVSFALDPSGAAHDAGIEAAPYTVELVDVEVDEDGIVRPSSPSPTAPRRNSDHGGKWWSFGWRKSDEQREREERKKPPVKKAKLARKVRVFFLPLVVPLGLTGEGEQVFHPPKDKVSIRCTWWGYELFLPEEVFLKLGNDIEPVASALQSLAAGLALVASNLPAALLALPGGALLKSLLPVISAIVAALSWYWKTVKSKDHGEGVILAATWVLPMAAVPRTLRWERWEKTGIVGVEAETEVKIEEKAAESGKSRGGLKRVLSLSKR